MPPKPKRKTYTVGLAVTLWLDYEMQADSLTDALTKASELNPNDVCSTDLTLNDHMLKIMGVSDSSALDRLFE